MSALAETAPDGYTPRQSAVLECALRLLVEGGEKALTTARIAREANCSKESLYKWFGDRDGLLAAVVSFQASKVRVKAPGEGGSGRAAFREHLVIFARDLMTVLSGEVSLALNRLAIGQASRDDAALGRLVLARGRRTIEARARALLGAGRAAGHVAFDDTGEAFRTLYGLIVQDSHVRMLLGEEMSAEERDFDGRAARAVDRFFRLFGAETGTDGGGQAGTPDENGKVREH